MTVNGQSSAILSILVLGAGTDYALLLVARYREELRREPDRHDALATALRTAGPAILASGVTVMLALLCLSFADVNGTAGLGPDRRDRHRRRDDLDADAAARRCSRSSAAGRSGRSSPTSATRGNNAMHGPWRRVGERIARRPRPVWIGAILILLVLALGLLKYNEGLTQGDSFRGYVESVQGQKLLSESFPSGANAPTRRDRARTRRRSPR